MNTMLDPQDFAERLERSFVDEPPHASYDADLKAGRRRLRRRRAAVVAGTLSVATVLAGSYLLMPRSQPAQVADELTDGQVVARCLGARVSDSWQGSEIPPAQVADAMGEARVVTRARTTHEIYATVRSEDGRSWGTCTLPTDKASRESRLIGLYRTDVTFPSRTVDGTRVYRPRDEGDSRVVSVGGTGPGWDVDCYPRGIPEDTHEFFVASSKCPTFHVAWNDRRPPEVAAAKIVNPDGTVGWADVEDGYLSYGYSAEMTPALRRQVAETEFRSSGPYGFVRDITLYDAAGRVIARGSDIHQGYADPTIQNYPSLAVTLEQDPEG